MEILIFIVIILVCCLVLNINVNYIFFGAVIIVEVFFSLMALGFAYCCIDLSRCKRKEAKFLRFEQAKNRKFQVACYWVDDRECQCVFPREMLFYNKLYSKDRTYWVLCNSKTEKVYDRFALTTCILGLLLSIIFIIIGIFFAKFYFGK